MTTYFISDIHLHAGSSANSKLLLNFLGTKGPTADAIYILGDLFAVWFGDDLAATYIDELKHALSKLATLNIPLYIMHGNRDFLLGDKFCQAAGCKLLADPCVINLYNNKILLTHGDLLCTQDSKYQKFRKFVQNPIIKFLFLSLPKWLRLKIGAWVQSKSVRNNNYSAKINPAILDVTPSEVITWLEKYQVNFMIHGHTHKPAIHTLNNTTRVVLGDWTNSSAKILAISAQDFKLVDLIATTPDQAQNVPHNAMPSSLSEL